MLSPFVILIAYETVGENQCEHNKPNKYLRAQVDKVVQAEHDEEQVYIRVILYWSCSFDMCHHI